MGFGGWDATGHGEALNGTALSSRAKGEGRARIGHHRSAGRELELDDALTDAWNLTGNPPPGNRVRLAGPMDGGWRVISLWDCAEQFREFLEERLQLALSDPGDQQPTATLCEIEKLQRFD
jgi:hypothetical protein